MMGDKPLLVSKIDVRSIPKTGQAVRIEANEAQRAAVAEEFGLTAVLSLAGDLDITRRSDGAILVGGRVAARIVQQCVVSFEPVEQAIDEEISLCFVAPDAPEASSPGADSAAVFDPEADPPDILAGDTIDLGAIVLEFMALGIDPYPRAPGAEVPEDKGESRDDREASPFAVLGKLINDEKH